MTSIAVSIAATVLPLAVQFGSKWVSNAAQTWGPAAAANTSIEAAAVAGASLFGNLPVLGKIGEVAGRAFGWAGAPFVGQAVLPQLGLAGQIGGAAAGALIHVVGSYALNKLGSTPQPEETAAKTFASQQQLLQNQLQMETLNKLKAQLDAIAPKENKIENLAKELNVTPAEFAEILAIIAAKKLEVAPKN